MKNNMPVTAILIMHSFLTKMHSLQEQKLF